MATDLNKIALKNLFFTRTAIGVYLTLLGVIATTCTDLADKYDTRGFLRATDWVRAVSFVMGTIATQGLVLAARVGANSSLVFTPSFLPGPNKQEVIDQVDAGVRAEPPQEWPPLKPIDRNFGSEEFPGE